MFACVFTAVLGMLGVAWYSLGDRLEEGEVEEVTRRELDRKEKRIKGLKNAIGLGKKGQ